MRCFVLNLKIAGKIENDNTKYVRIMISLKHLSNFLRTLEMSLINCEIKLILTWSTNCSLIDAPINNKVPTLTIADTKLCVPVVTLSTQDNAKLLQQLKSGFKRTISWHKYQSKVTVQEWNWYLDYLTDPSFQGVNSIFVLSFENNIGWASYKRYYLPQVEIKDYNVMINGLNFFDRPVKNNLTIYDNIQKIATGQGDDYITGCLLDYPYFKTYYKMIAIDLSKQQALDADSKTIQQINFTANLDQPGNTTFFTAKEAKETVLDFSQGTVTVL